MGIGVQKSGTSWLASVLEQHPQVMIKKKEISFFVQNYHRGYDWYHSWFEDRGNQVAGEITVSYMITPRPNPTILERYPRWDLTRKLAFWRSQPAARDELKIHYPEVKVFAIFRNPIERAWSAYWFLRNRKQNRHPWSKFTPFEKMFADDGRWLYSYGCYADQVKYWRDAFPNLGIFLFDDLITSPGKLANDIYSFIGIDASYQPNFSRRVNQGHYPPMPEALWQMVSSRYRPQIDQFSKLIDRDLEHWLNAFNNNT